MAFLDAQSRTVLFDPPDVYEEALARYALSAEDIACLLYTSRCV